MEFPLLREELGGIYFGKDSPYDYYYFLFQGSKGGNFSTDSVACERRGRKSVHSFSVCLSPWASSSSSDASH